jgi:hypothetical protein
LFPQFLIFLTAGAIEKPGFSAAFFDLTAKYVRISPVSGLFARLSRPDGVTSKLKDILDKGLS